VPWILLVALLFLFSLLFLLWLKEPIFRARGLCVLKGNLVDVLTHHPYGYRGVRRIHVIIDGISVPSVGEAGFVEARKTVSDLVVGEELKVRVKRDLAPDTVLGDILLQDDTWVKDRLLASGVATKKAAKITTSRGPVSKSISATRNP